MSFTRPFEPPVSSVTFAQLAAPYRDRTAAGNADIQGFFALYLQLPAPFQDLLDQIFAQPGLWDAYLRAPSSVKGHHRERGGNLRHSVEVAQLSLAQADAYIDMIDRDVVIISALMHDLGKTLEYELKGCTARMSTQGRLLGHKLTGLGLIWAPLHGCAGIGEHQRLAILNVLTCSANGAAWGGQAPGAFEAEIVCRNDQLSAIADMYRVSHARTGPEGGFGIYHKHQRVTPFHVKPFVAQPKIQVQAPPQAQVKAKTQAGAPGKTLSERLQAAHNASRVHFGGPGKTTRAR